MIPDDMVRDAYNAYLTASNLDAIKRETETPLGAKYERGLYPRDYIRAALEAVAAEIYNQGYDAGLADGEGSSYTLLATRPYRIEGA